MALALVAKQFAAGQRRDLEHRLELQGWRLVRFLSSRWFWRFLVRRVIAVQLFLPWFNPPNGAFTVVTFGVLRLPEGP